MAVTFTQTNTAAVSAAIAAHCSGNSNNGDTESNQASDGGSVGSTERTVTFDNNAADLNSVWMEIIYIDDYDGASGNWTTNLNVTSSNHQITLDEIHICHLDSSHGAKNTLGSLTGIGAGLGSTGVQSHVVNQGSNVTIAAGDVIVVIYAFDNGQNMANSIGYTPDDDVVGPGTILIHALDAEEALTFGQSDATLSGLGALVGTKQVTFAQAATLGGKGTLAGTKQILFDDAADLLQSNAIAASEVLTFAETALLGGKVPIDAIEALTIGIAANLDIGAPFEISLSSNIASGGEATTDRLTGGATHGGGRITDDQNPSNAVDLGDNESGEFAFVIDRKSVV